eukprot:GHVO01010773.1.p1 GENE.GHVO01010773.1~~GHVO01010773.1.p1  ORF type:complete len:236 (+),score=51.52 GHVO01010773.1:34-708(+)
MKPGRVQRVRGVAYSIDISNAFTTRMVTAARKPLNELLADVWVYVDTKGGRKPGEKATHGKSSKGYGMTLVAETSRGYFFGADGAVGEGDEFSTCPKGDLEGVSESVKELEDAVEEDEAVRLTDPEALGRLIASKLLLEISGNGVVDTMHQHIPLLFMACAEENELSKIVLSNLTPYATSMLRHIRDFLGVVFDIREYTSEGLTPGVLLQCAGCGRRNISRSTF